MNSYLENVSIEIKINKMNFIIISIFYSLDCELVFFKFFREMYFFIVIECDDGVFIYYFL
ncbi:conserved hypothetical protein [Xenorhabdus bovienii str. kraussei Quebec]|uniref:Uncharacterized protein n=2 Tax=Xenorhabdus bovienii TaxID=40576 RepID=A0A077PKA1_XENBV|nr:conserved hypothetical protein [Xenorhabdus bovienii str. kraussei Quebec]